MRLDKADFMLLLREPSVRHAKSSELDSVLTTGTTLLDVRLPEESDIARLPNTINTPLACLPLLMATQLDKKRNYVVYCDTGLRSRAAVSLLQENGFSAQYLSGGIDGLGLQQRVELLDVVLPLSPVATDAV
jgi:rhodanese-related sulfurtransferase